MMVENNKKWDEEVTESEGNRGNVGIRENKAQRKEEKRKLTVEMTTEWMLSVCCVVFVCV